MIKRENFFKGNESFRVNLYFSSVGEHTEQERKQHINNIHKDKLFLPGTKGHTKPMKYKLCVVLDQSN